MPFLKRLLIAILRRLARGVLLKYHPDVVGVTGSVGKTSAIGAIATVLASTYSVGRPPKNYNNEIGLPLAVLGATSGGRSPSAWLRVIVRGLGLLVRRAPYPKILVLELGADHPGDIAALVELVRPRVGVVTTVGSAHLEFFETLDAVVREKATLVARLPDHGIAVLNADDPLVAEMRRRTHARVITYGFAPNADVRASNLAYLGPAAGERVGVGMRCTVNVGQETATLQLPKALGRHLVSTALSALAVGVAYELTLAEVVAALEAWEPPPGRMRVIAGIKGTTLIDDTYNSSPLAAHAAVQVLHDLPSGEHRKFAVLGDMLELGAASEAAHRELGEAVAASGADGLICVGERARDIARGARAAGMLAERCYEFPDAQAAGAFLQGRIAAGDLVLAKASQGIRLERLVKELMTQPQRSSELLVRQGSEWQ